MNLKSTAVTRHWSSEYSERSLRFAKSKLNGERLSGTLARFPPVMLTARMASKLDVLSCVFRVSYLLTIFGRQNDLAAGSLNGFWGFAGAAAIPSGV